MHMVWVYLGIVIGIVGLMVEMWIAYRKGASHLRAEQTHVREHTQRIMRREEETRGKIEAATAHAETLKTEKQYLAKDLAAQKQWCVEMETEERTRHPTKFLFKEDPEDPR